MNFTQNIVKDWNLTSQFESFVTIPSLKYQYFLYRVLKYNIRRTSRGEEPER